MRAPTLSNRNQSRFAAGGIALILIVLLAGTFLAATRGERGLEALRGRYDRAAQVETTRRMVAQSRSLLRDAQHDSSRAGLPATKSAAARALSDLEGAHVQGLRAARAALRSYAAAARGYLMALDAGQRDAARSIQTRLIAPAVTRVDGALDDATDRVDASIQDRLGKLEHTQEVTLVAIPVGGSALLLLIFFLGRVLLRVRRREVQRRSRLEFLEQAALSDSLTGVRNHRAFQEDLEREVRRHTRSSGRMSLVLMDMDHLKRVNDSRGHQAGDTSLQTLAASVVATVRGSDAVYRVGGDEFALILAGESAWGAFHVVERIQERLAKSGGEIPLSVTAGVSEMQPGDTRDALVRRADRALIEGKRINRACMLWTDDLGEVSEEAEGVLRGEHVRAIAMALARAVDAKDSYTRSHSETVSMLCALIGEQLGVGRDRVARLRLAGLLHDVGKIGVPDEILQKPAALDAHEWEVMKTHPTVGHHIVAAAGLREEARWIRHHHERVDGTGYPDGLSGDAILLESRVILVADAFEAITSDRPYRPGRPEDEAFAELERHAGTQFDAGVVEALATALRARTAAEPLAA